MKGKEGRGRRGRVEEKEVRKEEERKRRENGSVPVQFQLQIRHRIQQSVCNSYYKRLNGQYKEVTVPERAVSRFLHLMLQ